MSTILDLAPQNVWKHFYSLTQIPRPSGHMEKKELPEEIQIKKVQKADSEIKYISFGTYNI